MPNQKKPFLAIIFFTKPDYLGGTKIYCKRIEGKHTLPIVEVIEEKELSESLSKIISKNIPLGNIEVSEKVYISPKEKFNDYDKITVAVCEISWITLPSMTDEFMSLSDIMNNQLLPGFMLEALMRNFDSKAAA